jgi:hypothetical protein
MDAREMSVPVGFPGEHRKISFIDGSASIVFFTCMILRSTMLSPRTVIERYLIHTYAETSLFSVYMLYVGGCDKDFLASWRGAGAHEKIDDLARPDSKENMIRARQVA